MGSVELVWADLRHGAVALSCSDEARHGYSVVRTTNGKHINELIREYAPRALCAEFDRPHAAGLRILQDILADYPALPVLMLTQHHSEELAIWAFRCGVWDYLASPEGSDLRAALASLVRPALPILPRPVRRVPLPQEYHSEDNPEAKRRTQPAIAYVETHMDKKIALNALAPLCHMSVSEFCRAFKKERGMTLSEYLLKVRMDKALDLLVQSAAPVKSIAFAVGFNDVSYFTRVFHRAVGMPPSEYRLCHGDRSRSARSIDSKPETREQNRCP